ncbi:ketopantoate reductase family protein [Paludibacter sp.]|uniref:ketopantoate reductase family protein n=1 Tax=Paludibacter sp. TaxID=1898105 RepID=UPI001354BBE0|nr:ketopantoate reductase family protein [Paludibacter sp.]MTK54032.1 ketopantoate reductase family protein [Paludibacter sp.]
MKIAIIGTGGVGGYFGGRLAKAGNDVTFLARGKHLEAMMSHGLIVQSIKENFTIQPVQATDSITSIGKVDLILLCVKSWLVKDMAKELMPLLKEETVVLPLQNGVMAAEELQSVIPVHHVLGGLCRIISKIEAPGVIRHFGVDPTVVFAELNNGKSERVVKLQKVFEQAEFNARISHDIQADIWKKFIQICISGLLGVTRVPYGGIREVKETREMMIALFQEVYDLSQKLGVNIAPDFVEKTVGVIDSFDYNASASLARDIWEGRPSELEYQNGTVVRLAEKYGLEVPVNKFIYSALLPQERKARQ